MISRFVPLASIAVLSLAFLSGCSFLGSSAATVDSGDVANAAEDWLKDDEDVKYSVECEDEELTLAEDESIDCIATDRDTDLEYDVEITIAEVDGEDFKVDVNRDEDAIGGDDDDSGSDSDDVFSLALGDCFNDGAVGIGDDESVDTINIVDCNTLHEREVYAQLTFEGDDDDYPAEVSVVEDTDAYCMAEFEEFVGTAYNDSELYYVTLYPSQESWETGDRESLCMISEYDSNDDVVPVEGSLEGAQR